jgi:hypothetical protein
MYITPILRDTCGQKGLAPMHLIFMVLLLPFLALHFLPSIIACIRRARNLGWILVINIFLGWTIIGWVVALLWALRDDPRYEVGHMPPPPPPYNR